MSMLMNTIITIQSFINTAHQLIICLINDNIYVKRFMPLTSNTAEVCSVLYHVLTSTAIWLGNFLTFYNNFVLFWCYSCVYNTIQTMKVLFTDPVSTTAELDLLIMIFSQLTKILLCVLLVTVTISYNLTLYYKAIKSGFTIILVITKEK